MSNVQNVLDVLNKIAPERLACSFDHVGLQIGTADDVNAQVKKAVISLDRSWAAVQFAVQQQAQLLITHHPFFMRQPFHRIRYNQHQGRAIIELIRNGITQIAAHTNWDFAKNGLNDKLAEVLELQDVTPFGEGEPQEFVVVTINQPSEPHEHTEKMLDELTKIGATAWGDYDRCACYFKGTDTFLPMEGANPFVGKVGESEVVPVTQLQIRAPKHLLSEVHKTIRKHHPYEEPSYELLCTEPLLTHPGGRIGKLKNQMSLSELGKFVEQKLGTNIRGWGDPNMKIEKLAVFGGSADSQWKEADARGAQALVTGEVKQHIGVSASEHGFGMIEAGHYATEQPGCAKLQEVLKQHLPDIEWTLFTPQPGIGGRPFA